MSELARIVEALLFLSSDPVSVEELGEACEVDAAAIGAAIEELRAEFADGRRGLVLREVAGGLTLASDPIAETAARRLLAKPRIASLTPAQMEALAIVAYLQPISRPEMARIRGVNTDSPVTSLLDRGLIEESGRSSFGAVMYATTPLFLKLFGLQDTSGLPDVAEWDPSPEEQAELRDRLLRAGEARAGIGSPPSEAAPEAVGSDGQ
jgi:segregation and condensation protein B